MTRESSNNTKRDGRSEADLVDKSRNLALDGLVEMLAQIHRAKQAREDVRERSGRRGETRSDSPRVEFDSRETAGDFLFDLAKTQLSIIEQLLRFQRKHADYLVDRMRQSSSSSGTRNEGGDGSLLIVRGTVTGDNKERIFEPIGLASFIVENRSSRPATISIRLSELRSRDGGVPFHARHIQFSWDVQNKTEQNDESTKEAEFTLAADQERTVNLTSIMASQIKKGHRYRGHIEIACTGRPLRRLPLRIDVEET